MSRIERLFQMPIPDMPGSIERRKHFMAAEDTAAHETGHAGLAHKRGLLKSVSALPNSDSLGRTEISESATPKIFQEIAAGGAIDPPGFVASGYGSDMHKVALISLTTGESPAMVRTKAKARLSSYYSVGERKRIAEMLALEGEASADRFEGYTKQAKFEEEVMKQGLPIDDYRGEGIEKFVEERVIPLVGKEGVIYMSNQREKLAA